MDFGKMTQSKINLVADWIIRIIVTNVLIILCSIPIITLYPALIAGYAQLHKYMSDEPTTLFKGFFTSFKEQIGRKILTGVIITGFLYLSISNTIFYSLNMENQGWFYVVGYFVTLSIITMFYALSLYGIIVMSVIPKLSFVNMFKVSVFLAGKYFIKTLLIVFSSFIPVFLLFSPYTHVVLIFAGLSIPLFLIMLLSLEAVGFLKDQNVTRD